MKNSTISTADQVNLAREVESYWMAGGWQYIVSRIATDSDCRATGELLPYLLSALFMLGKAKEALAALEESNLSGKQKKLFIRLLIAGSQQALSNARFCSGDKVTAKLLAKKSLSHHGFFGPGDFWQELRNATQLKQMGVPHIACPDIAINHSLNLKESLEGLSHSFEGALSLRVAQAELYYQQGEYDESIRCWQDMASSLGEDMPQAYYERLKDAYKLSGGFPRGTSDEEQVFGEVDKHILLKHIHEWLNPRFYLEIGVQSGKSLSIASCPSVGVDPMPMIKHELNSNVEIVRSSSDHFFSTMGYKVPSSSFDLAFVDGMHLFEYVLRDFINIEAISHKRTVVVIDDIYPGHEAQAQRTRRTKAWTGDVWKFFDILKKYRKDLFLLPIDVYPTGVLMVLGLDKENKSLAAGYSEIVNEYRSVVAVPPEYIKRLSASKGELIELEKVVRQLYEAYR